MFNTQARTPAFYPSLGALLLGSSVTVTGSATADTEGRNASKSVASGASKSVLSLLDIADAVGRVSIGAEAEPVPPQTQAIYDAHEVFVAGVEAGNVSLEAFDPLLALMVGVDVEPSDSTVHHNETLLKYVRKCYDAINSSGHNVELQHKFACKRKMETVRTMATVHSFVNQANKFVNAGDAAKAAKVAQHMKEIFCQEIHLPGLTEEQMMAVHSALRLCVHYCYGNVKNEQMMKDMLQQVEAHQEKILSNIKESFRLEDKKAKSIEDFEEAARAVIAAAQAESDVTETFKQLHVAFNGLPIKQFKQQDIQRVRGLLVECTEVVKPIASDEFSRFCLSRLEVMKTFVTKVEEREYPLQPMHQ